MMKRFFFNIVCFVLAIVVSACSGNSMQPTGEQPVTDVGPIDLGSCAGLGIDPSVPDTSGGPLRVTPVLVLVDHFVVGVQVCFIASGGNGHYNWNLDSGDGLLVSGGAYFRAVTFRPNGPGQFGVTVTSGDGQRKSIGGRIAP